MSAQMPKDVITLGAAIYHLRNVRRMTLRQLANAVGVSAPFLCDLEKDRRSTDRLDAFAAALGVEVETLSRYDSHRKQFTRADLARAREQGFNEAREMAAKICENEVGERRYRLNWQGRLGVAATLIRTMQPAKKGQV